MSCLPGVRASAQLVESQSLDTPDAVFPEPFSMIRGFRELSDGRVLITDWREERLVGIDFEAATATDIGRVGAGPREYRLPDRLTPYPGDSTLLFDWGNSRLAIIGPDLAIHRTMPYQPKARMRVNPRAVDDRGVLYFVIPRFASGRPDASSSASVDIGRFDPETGDVQVVTRIKGSTPPSWRKQNKPRLTPGIPMVMFAAQDGWAVSLDGRLAIVRSGDYHVEWRETNGTILHGSSYAYDGRPVTYEDKWAFVERFLTGTPISGRGPDGGLGHSPPPSRAEIERMIETNEFADVHPYFVPAGVWLGPGDSLWVERSVPLGAGPILDVFDERGRMVRQIALPSERRVVGIGNGAVYTVVKDEFDLETLERYIVP